VFNTQWDIDVQMASIDGAEIANRRPLGSDAVNNGIQHPMTLSSSSRMHDEDIREESQALQFPHATDDNDFNAAPSPSAQFPHATNCDNDFDIALSPSASSQMQYEDIHEKSQTTDLLLLQFPHPTDDDDFNISPSPSSSSQMHHEDICEDYQTKDSQPLQFTHQTDDDDFNIGVQMAFTTPLPSSSFFFANDSTTNLSTTRAPSLSSLSRIPDEDICEESQCIAQGLQPLQFPHATDDHDFNIAPSPSTLSQIHHEDIREESQTKDSQPLQFAHQTDDDDFNIGVQMASTTPLPSSSLYFSKDSTTNLSTMRAPSLSRIPDVDIREESQCIGQGLQPLQFPHATDDHDFNIAPSPSTLSQIHHEDIREESQTIDLPPLQFPSPTDDNNFNIDIQMSSIAPLPSSLLCFANDSTINMATARAPSLYSSPRMHDEDVREKSQPIAQDLQPLQFPHATDDHDFNIAPSPPTSSQMHHEDIREESKMTDPLTLQFPNPTDDNDFNIALAPFSSRQMHHEDIRKEFQTMDLQPLQFPYPTHDNDFNMIVSIDNADIAYRPPLESDVVTNGFQHSITRPSSPLHFADGSSTNTATIPISAPSPSASLQMPHGDIREESQTQDPQPLQFSHPTDDNDFNIVPSRSSSSRMHREDSRIAAAQVDGNTSDGSSNFNMALANDMKPVPNVFRRHDQVKAFDSSSHKLSKGKGKSIFEYQQRPSSSKYYIHQEERSHQERMGEDERSKYDDSGGSYSHKSFSDQPKPRYSDLVFEEDEYSDYLQDFPNSGDAALPRQHNPLPPGHLNLVFEDECVDYLQDQATTHPDRPGQNVLQVIGHFLELPDILLNGNIRNPS
jgi:hypothetical protein